MTKVQRADWGVRLRVLSERTSAVLQPRVLQEEGVGGEDELAILLVSYYVILHLLRGGGDTESYRYNT